MLKVDASTKLPELWEKSIWPSTRSAIVSPGATGKMEGETGNACRCATWRSGMTVAADTAAIINSATNKAPIALSIRPLILSF